MNFEFVIFAKILLEIPKIQNPILSRTPCTRVYRSMLLLRTLPARALAKDPPSPIRMIVNVTRTCKLLRMILHDCMTSWWQIYDYSGVPEGRRDRLPRRDRWIRWKLLIELVHYFLCYRALTQITKDEQIQILIFLKFIGRVSSTNKDQNRRKLIHIRYSKFWKIETQSSRKKKNKEKRLRNEWEPLWRRFVAVRGDFDLKKDQNRKIHVRFLKISKGLIQARQLSKSELITPSNEGGRPI